MNVKSIGLAMKEADELIVRAKAALTEIAEDGYAPSPRTSGALRRQSMELTRALTDMRKP